MGQTWGKLYRLGITGLGAVVLATTLAIGLGGTSTRDWIGVAILMAASTYLNKRALDAPGGRVTFSGVPLLASLMVLGLLPSLLLTMPMLLIPVPWERRAFSMAMTALSLGASWLSLRHVNLGDLSVGCLAFLVTGLVTFGVVNLTLVSISRLLDKPMPLGVYIQEQIQPLVEGYWFALSLAALGALAYVKVGWTGTFLAVTMLIALIGALEKSLALRAQNELSIQSLIATIEAKDPFTRGHSDRVAELARKLAVRMKLKPAQVSLVWNAGRLHDIGKIGVPDSVLTKAGRLTEAEYLLVQTHAATGERILSSRGDWRDLAEIAGQHHEWHNGKGYPRGLSGDQIRLEARILAIADAYDAMTTTRSYRPARSVDAALQEIEGCAGTQFDPLLAHTFVRMMRREQKMQGTAEGVSA